MKSTWKHRAISAAVLALLLDTASSAVAVAKPKMGCRVEYNKRWPKKPSHKAFATSGGKSAKSYDISCGFSYGFATKAAAKAEAIRLCSAERRKHRGHPKCIIIDER